MKITPHKYIPNTDPSPFMQCVAGAWLVVTITVISFGLLSCHEEPDYNFPLSQSFHDETKTPYRMAAKDGDHREALKSERLSSAF
jgi:hypothetical protein